MARKKVNLRYITDAAARRATLKKRRANLMKKASELATLCDVETCVVVYAEGESRPQVWPSSATDAARILDRFKVMPEMEQSKNMMDMEIFLEKRVAKMKEQLEKMRRENHVQETKLLLHEAMVGRRPGLAGLSIEELASLGSMVNTRLEAIMNRIQRLKVKEQGHDDPKTMLQMSLPSPAAPPIPDTEVVEAPGPDPKGWLLGLTEDGGFGGENGSFGGDAGTGASTSGGLGDLLQLGNTMIGLPMADDQLPPPM